jgi:NAD(P)H-hydrate epimerase
VLKGPVTRIMSGASTYHSFFGGPVLARGGSGDLLAGLIGGLLAQLPDDPLLAAARGVVWHGVAADLLARAHGQVAVHTVQLLDHLPAALRMSTDEQ